MVGATFNWIIYLRVCYSCEADNRPVSSPCTLILNTEDHYVVGDCPRYLLAEIFELFRQNSNLEVRVERVNKPPTPLQFRLLCKMSVNAINDFRPFSSPQYQPLIAEIAAAAMSS